MKRFRCPVCGCVFAGERPPETCPTCGATGRSFAEDAAERKPCPAGHVSGVAAGVEPAVLEGLRRNFDGACRKAGAYLAMARAAEREGYPEIGAALERYAAEETGQAARFAELLGERAAVSTKQNLSVCADMAYGAAEAKNTLAKRAKAFNLDAIHDALHEMARDDAQRGNCLEGLLRRYFS